MASFGGSILPFILPTSNRLQGRDAKRLVILRGDFEGGEEKGGLVKEDIAKKYSAYFQVGLFLDKHVTMNCWSNALFSEYSSSQQRLLYPGVGKLLTSLGSRLLREWD